jgi:Zn-dependent M28 family amino/carboxypeptidase
MALPPRIRIVNKSKTSDLQSPNVIGVLRGTDPALRDEYVVISAHLDHLGIAEPVNGDAIYNGAVDNASGVAVLIELARMFAAAAPRRSILFIAVTGEEPGLIGSDYFAQHPTVPRDALVADINVDGASMWDFDALFARGADHSSLKTNVEASGETIVGDPFPDQAGFVRSDQYSFVRIGVPSIILGAKRSADARALALDWVKNRYHQPSDDMSQPLDFLAAARFAQDLYKVAQSIAQQEQRPKWNKGDFFGVRFGTAATVAQ